MELIFSEKHKLGYELYFIGFTDIFEIDKFLSEITLTTGSKLMTPLLPIFKNIAEKYNLEYRETILAKHKGLRYWLLKFSTWAYHYQFSKIGEFKYRIEHQIERVYE